MYTFQHAVVLGCVAFQFDSASLSVLLLQEMHEESDGGSSDGEELGAAAAAAASQIADSESYRLPCFVY